ncbi:hypothetical protein [Lihuaxuella thermophila]|uniref:hypothetical protein n=1 Tax=Lihuaxuella thermophila TaxID=1173111 RepID=UPI000B7F58AB|nr:hypothetical protein [Lihuaxuella thermophila]
MRLRNGLMMVCCLFFFLFSHTIHVYAEEAKTPEQKMAELEAEMERLKAKGENYDFLKEEVKNFRESVQKERESLTNTFNIYLGLLTGIIGVAGLSITIVGFIFYFKVGQSRKELDDQINTMKKEMQDRLNQLEYEFTEKVRKKFQKEMEKVAAQLINEEMDTYKESLEALNELIDKELKNKKVRVLVTGPEDEIKKMEENELKILNKQVYKTTVKPFDKAEIAKELQNNEFDIIIYRYPKTNEGGYQSSVGILAQMLKQHSRQLPLLVYSDYGKIDDPELNTYLLRSYANIPSSLISNLFSLYQVFYKQEAKVPSSVEHEEF